MSNKEEKEETKKEITEEEIFEMKEKICGKDPSPYVEEFVFGMPDDIFLERIKKE